MSKTRIPDKIIGHFRVKNDGPLCCLYEDEKLWMTDGPIDIRTQQKFVDQCNGRILVGGLGLGLVVEQFARKSDISSITVVEKSSEIIEMVWPHLVVNSKVRIVCQDIFDYLKSTKEKYDYIYLDIWQNDDKESYERTLLPLRVLAEKLVPAQRVLCWAEKAVRQL